jgi:DNA-binding winged helix-turn-helix (wHTH) protein
VSLSEEIRFFFVFDPGVSVAVSFGDCVFDAETRELSRRGDLVHLPAKTFRLLEVLLERRPKAISKEKLMESLWPGTFVAEGNLARLLAELRDAIGDDAHEPRFIRTIHGFGYAFSGETHTDCAEGTGSDAGSVFKLIWGDREIALHEGENVLGRDRDAVAWVDVGSVSRHHARIVVSGEKARLEDLGSKNGTFVKGRKLAAPRDLKDGDEIRIGTVPMTFRRFASPETTQTARSG